MRLSLVLLPQCQIAACICYYIYRYLHYCYHDYRDNDEKAENYDDKADLTKENHGGVGLARATCSGQNYRLKIFMIITIIIIFVMSIIIMFIIILINMIHHDDHYDHHDHHVHQIYNHYSKKITWG